MKLLKKLISQTLLLAMFLSFEACAATAKVKLELPQRVALEECPVKPDVTGVKIGDKVQITLSDAMLLAAWIAEYPVCMESNVARLQGNIEKLENRINAVN